MQNTMAIGEVISGFQELCPSILDGFTKFTCSSYSNMPKQMVKEVDVRICESFLCYSSFFETYLIANYPCILNSSATKDWESRNSWVKKSNLGEPNVNQDGSTSEFEDLINFEYIRKNYGNEKVNVTNCDKMVDHECCETVVMTISEYIEYWERYKEENYSSSMPCLYLKDWHLMRTISTQNCVKVNKPYEVPIYFKSDWLNEFCNESDLDDFCFSYMGPKGSWTGFHSDVYGSFSWSANVIGRKKWWIYLPERMKALYETKSAEGRSRIVYNYDNPGVEGTDYYEVIQEAGQVIFIPSGWYHIVWNLEDTISINHNWFNGSNLVFIWKTLSSALNDVEIELSDLKNDDEYSALCQSLLKANHGLNYDEFVNILLFIWAKRNSLQLQQSSSSTSTATTLPDSPHLKSSHLLQPSSIGPIHVQYDLKCIQNTVELIENDVKDREETKGIIFPKSFLEKITQFSI